MTDFSFEGWFLMERSVRVLLGLASLVLVAVVWLAFHDFAEAHSVRDWLTLLSAIIVWVATVLTLRQRELPARGEGSHAG